MCAAQTMIGNAHFSEMYAMDWALDSVLISHMGEGNWRVARSRSPWSSTLKSGLICHSPPDAGGVCRRCVSFLGFRGFAVQLLMRDCADQGFKRRATQLRDQPAGAVHADQSPHQLAAFAEMVVSSVYPSAGARTTAAAARLPPAPGWFSIVNG